jgi:hypothetical protein
LRGRGRLLRWRGLRRGSTFLFFLRLDLAAVDDFDFWPIAHIFKFLIRTAYRSNPPRKMGAPHLDFEMWESANPNPRSNQHKHPVPHPFAFFAKGWETNKPGYTSPRP